MYTSNHSIAARLSIIIEKYFNINIKGHDNIIKLVSLEQFHINYVPIYYLTTDEINEAEEYVIFIDFFKSYFLDYGFLIMKILKH